MGVLVSAGIGTVSESEQRFRRHGRNPHRYLGLDVSTLARALLPEGWPQHRELAYAARQVSSIEINGSFYSLQPPESYRAWYEAMPEGSASRSKASFLPKGRDGWLMRRAPAAPLVVNEPISCNNPIGASNLLLWTPLVGVSLQGPSQIKGSLFAETSQAAR